MKKCFSLTLLFFGLFSKAQVSIVNVASTYSQDFNTLANTGTTNAVTTLPAGWTFLETGTGNNTTYAADNGAANGGNTYSYGTTATTERALGGLQSGSVVPTAGASFINNTGGSIASITVSYTGEQWRLGTLARQDKLDFQYSTNATALNTGTWTDENGLDFIAPVTTGAVGPLDGNAAANRTVISAVTITFASPITNGSTFWIRWNDLNASGADDGLAIDDVTVTFAAGGADVTPPTISSTTPADNAANVSIYTSPLQIVFNEPVLKGTGNIVIRRASDNTAVQTIDVTSAAVTIAGATASVTISTLTNATDYYVEADAGSFTDAALNNFAGIAGNTTWNFTTEALPAAGILNNNYSFVNCSSTFITEGWRQYSVTGNEIWGCNTAGRTDAFGLQMNGFSGTAQNNEDWLISPPFDLTAVNLPYLRFYSFNTFAGNSLELRVSTNYLPGSNPNTATWTTLNGSFPAANTSTWTLSDNISLASFNTSNVYIAWVYTSNTTEASRWRLDDIAVMESLPACAEPASQPTGLTLTPTPTTVAGSFTDAVPAADEYVVIRSTAATLTVLPADGTIYTAGQAIGNGIVIATGASTTFTDAGLAPSTQYYYFVFANKSDNCSNGPNYSIVLNPGQNTGSTTTLALPPCVAPAAAPTVLSLTPLSTVISGTFTAAAGANRYLVVESTSPTLSAAPADGVTYSTGQSLGGGTVVSYGSTNSFTATGLTASTQYYFFVFAASGECTGEPLYFATSLDGTATTTAGGGGIPPGYYTAADGLTCAPLKTALFNIIKPTVANPSPTYDGICVVYTATDYRKSDDGLRDIIWDMYSDNPGVSNPDPYEFEYCIDVDGCTSNCSPAPSPNNPPIPGTAEGQLYNREHSFPRNWFGGAVEPMNSDITHIFPTDKEVNARRSNWPYGETTTPTWTSLNGSKLGPSTFPGYTGTVFEPINEYKGDFARAQFYMVTAYQNLITGWPGTILNGTTHQSFDDWYLQLLYKWHTQDPVSAKEIDRNNAVYAIQGNRNPFIDHPEYVESVWGGGCLAVLPVSLVSFTAQKNNDGVVLNWVVAREINVKMYEIESSTDGRTFTKIGGVTAKGISNYYFTDTRVHTSKVVYYRLKTIDTDGRFTTGNTVSVKFLNGYTGATVFPNPANQKITLQLQKPLTQNSVLQVMDITGRVIWQQQTISGQKNIELNTQSLTAGRYFIKLADKNAVINQSFIIVH